MTEIVEVSGKSKTRSASTADPLTLSNVWMILANNSSEFNSLCQTLDQQVRIYLPNSTLYCYSGDLPEKIRSQLIPLKFNVDYREAIRAHPKFISGTIETVRIDDNRELITLRSQLAYLLAEYYGIDSLYFKLTEQVNSESTYRNFWYQLYSNEIPCWSNVEMENLMRQQLASSPVSGPLMINTALLSGLAGNATPDWYVREIFRDIYELDEFLASDQFQLIEGPQTGELYLFYRTPINLTEGRVEKFNTKIRQALRTSLDLKIFPRRTPDQFIETRSLVPTKQGQWKISLPDGFDLPDKLSIFTEIYDSSFNFQTLHKLGSFLTLISDRTPEIRERILFGLEFDLSGRALTVRYRTRYLADFLTVHELARGELNSSLKFHLRYPSLQSENLAINLSPNLSKQRLLLEFDDLAQSTRGQIWTESP